MTDVTNDLHVRPDGICNLQANQNCTRSWQNCRGLRIIAHSGIIPGRLSRCFPRVIPSPCQRLSNSNQSERGWGWGCLSLPKHGGSQISVPRRPRPIPRIPFLRQVTFVHPLRAITIHSFAHLRTCLRLIALHICVVCWASKKFLRVGTNVTPRHSKTC